MQIVKVYIEHPNANIGHTFDYVSTDDSITKGVRVLVEFNNRELMGFVAEVMGVSLSRAAYEDRQGFALKEILKVIDESPLLNEELFACADYLAYVTMAPKISVFQAMLPNKLKPSSSSGKVRETVYLRLVSYTEGKYRGRRQEALDFLRENKAVERSEFNKLFPGVSAVLLRDGLAEVFSEEKKYQGEEKTTVAHLQLTSSQQSALQQIQESDKEVLLLHGATGSGKTEIYLQLAQEAINSGQQVLILVPEISLTPQMVARVESRFGSQVAIYHSRLNNQEKYEQYQRVKNKEVDVVVGTRSAVFMPFEKLGLIVLDEEHDLSYKQDSLPRYHTRDVAMWRGKYHSCKTILGSATPALESYARAYKGIYELVELPERINGQNLPQCHLIDTRQSLQSGDSNLLTRQLRQEIAVRLSKNQQVILLLNRRGYIPIVKCRDCGTVVMCDNCDVAMNYHRDENILICHTCGATKRLPDACSNCNSTYFIWWGYGTQRLEEECQKFFPAAHIIRMDTDTVSKKGSHEAILSTFENKGDILVGTQMIAKGLDYPRVTLVGILNADAMLAHTDYRSVELTFDLIVQASGRSGRAADKGEVLIQAFDTQHYAIRAACHHDYKRFFNEEMQYRHVGFYPPYSYMTSIVLSHRDKEICEEEATELLGRLTEYEELKILGPSELLKKRTLQRSRILLKSSDFERMLEILHHVYQQWLAERKKCSVLIDVNPLYLD